MRLIDADVEISKIDQEIQRIDNKIKRLKELMEKEPLNTIHDFKNELERCYRNKLDCRAEIATLNNYETAYNVDVVIERLEEERNPMYRADGSLMAERRLIEIDKAVEIVKYGGVIG